MNKAQIKEQLIKILKKNNLNVIIDERNKLDEIMSSIEIIEFVAEIEELFDTFFDDDEIISFNGTLNEIVEFLMEKELIISE